MDSATCVLQVERTGNTLILMPLANIGPLDYRKFEDEAQSVLKILDANEARNVVVDFTKTDYFGSDAINVLLRIWKSVKRLGGRMALCGLSRHEVEVVNATNLDSMWPICATRDDALTTVA
jgi:anti-anti-sigma factor